jgi:signal transduction histidine kinase
MHKNGARCMNESTLKEARILMLDDEVGSTCLTTHFLQRIGYSRVESINDSSNLFAMIESFAPDLILLDLAMPKFNGLQVLEALRRNGEKGEEISVLVLTGNATTENKRLALAAGATDLLAKPFDPPEASMRIRNLLQARFLRLEIEEQNRLLEERVRLRTRELEQALENLHGAQQQMLQQERLSAFGEMSCGVVHDFSNALMSIIGYSEMLLSNPATRTDDAVAIDYLRIINTAGRDGAHIVSRLRDFYRPRDAADVFEELDLDEIATQSIALAKPRCLKRGVDRRISFETEFAESPKVNGIRAELREALINLIFNAVDAIPDEGIVTLRTRERDGEAIIEVVDNGVGMTSDVLNRCLEPFFTTKGDVGTGLGLAMVFGIVQRHQGQVEIESEPGLGATVRIHMPSLSLTASRAQATDRSAEPLLDILVDEQVAHFGAGGSGS